MIPVELYGIDVEQCEEFYRALPQLVADTIDDETYCKGPVCHPIRGFT